MEAVDMGGDLEKILLTAEQTDARLAQLVAQIDEEYRSRDLLLVRVLRGAVMTMADLSRKIRVPLGMDWAVVSSYGSGAKSSGIVRILKDFDTDIQERNVLIVEDVTDSGLTLSWLRSNLLSKDSGSVRIAIILRKPEVAKVAIDVDYAGFDIPNEFVVGYELDYAERYHHLPFVGMLAPHIYGG